MCVYVSNLFCRRTRKCAIKTPFSRFDPVTKFSYHRMFINRKRFSSSRPTLSPQTKTERLFVRINWVMELLSVLVLQLVPYFFPIMCLPKKFSLTISKQLEFSLRSFHAEAARYTSLRNSKLGRFMRDHVMTFGLVIDFKFQFHSGWRISFQFSWLV